MSAPSVPVAPEIAILGHPNEGKSSVLSTLAEDDSVRVSPFPGETTECRTYPVRIDGREVLRFTDTPGFQNPGRVLAEMRELAGAGGDCVALFRRKFADVAELREDVELLQPVERGAGIIYVVDGSRPLRNVDRAEMEILRLSGRPRMAIINCKAEDLDYLDAWKSEFRKNFNANRVFNAHRATYVERILLLEALKSIDQDWQPTLEAVVAAFKADWTRRNSLTVDILLTLLTDCLRFSVDAPLPETGDRERLHEQLIGKYCSAIGQKEQAAHRRIRALFKHNIFNYELPPHSILREDLFSEKTWHLLGLSAGQLTVLGGLGGAALGLGLDLATAGIALGVFTGIATAAGALGALLGGKKLSKKSHFLGLHLGGERLQVGPAANISLLFILINRALLFYRYTINWAHGRRDVESAGPAPGTRDGDTGGYTSDWSASRLRVCHTFFSMVTKDRGPELAEASGRLREILSSSLTEISRHE
jgi:Domain of unknown function (DUF3482)/50S ribosome-binding GTPase